MTLQLKKRFLMQLLYKLKNNFAILVIALLLSSCSVIPDNLSCKFSEIDCYRFDYTSLDSFKDSVEDYSYEWSLADPSNALSNLIFTKDLSIHSLKDSKALIETSPENMFVLGQYLVERQKPREWLFESEQVFIRSWNKLSR